MKKITFFTLLLTLFILSTVSNAQIGVNNTNPKSILDIAASNPSNPTQTDGILLPRISKLPSINPTADQDGMLAFLDTPDGHYKKGLHYWNNSLSTWVPYGGEWADSYNGGLEDLAYATQANSNYVTVVVTDDGKIGLGTDSPQESLEIKMSGDNDIQITSATPPNAPNFIFFTKKGTFNSPSRMTDNTPIGAITGTVWTGSGRSDNVAMIRSAADGNHSSTNLATKFNLSTTGTGYATAGANGIEMTIKASGNIGIGTETPTAYLQLKAGTASAESAPLKFNAGTNLSTPEAGTLEFDGTHLYFTPSTSRKILLKGLTNTATLNFPVIVNGVTDELTVTVPGANIGSSCNCAPVGGIETNLKWSCYVSAANTVTVRLSNISASAIDPSSRSWKVTVIE